jgi:hypothetical protein
MVEIPGRRELSDLITLEVHQRGGSYGSPDNDAVGELLAQIWPEVPREAVARATRWLRDGSYDGLLNLELVDLSEGRGRPYRRPHRLTLRQSLSEDEVARLQEEHDRFRLAQGLPSEPELKTPRQRGLYTDLVSYVRLLKRTLLEEQRAHAGTKRKFETEVERLKARVSELERDLEARQDPSVAEAEELAAEFKALTASQDATAT